MIQYGLELEFGSLYTRYSLVQRLSKILPIKVSEIGTIPDYTKYWYLGTDASIISTTADKQKGTHGLELRSPIFSRFPSKTLSKILGFLRENHCFVTPTSGLHFHFSGIYLGGHTLSEYFNSKMMELSRQVRKMRIAKHARKAHCLDISGRYTPVRLVESKSNHYECRIFNSSLKTRAIYQNWKTLNKMLQKFESNMLGTNEVGESPTIIAEDCAVNHLICPPVSAEDYCGLPVRQ